MRWALARRGSLQLPTVLNPHARHAAQRRVHPFVGEIHSVTAHQVPGVEGRAGAPAAAARREIRRRKLGEQRLASLRGRCRARPHGVGAHREKQVPVGIHEPPPAFDFFDAEETGGLGLGLLEAAVAAIVEVARAQRFLFFRPSRFQLIQVLGLARPVVVDPLAELVHHRLRIQQGIAGIFLGQLDRADLQRGRAHRSGHHEPDLLHRVQRSGSAREVDEHHGPQLVGDRRQVVPLAHLIGEETERHRRADPGSGHRRQAHGPNAASSVYAQVEALRRRRTQFEHQEVVGAPIGGQPRVKLLDRPLPLRTGLVESDAPRFGLD